MQSVTHLLTKTINYDLDLEDIKSAYTVQELSHINNYAQIIQSTMDIDALFEMFRANLYLMHQYYEFKNSDVLISKRKVNDNVNDDILINALTIGFISAGKTVVEAIERFSNEVLGKNNSFKKNCLSAIYDKCFSYRLLYHIRNFAQHGYLPVSVDGENLCCFDLFNILGATHFNQNKKLKNEIEQIKEIIMEEFEDYPRLHFTRMLAEYNLCVVEIYKEFLSCFEKFLLNARKDIIHLIKRKPEVLHNSNDTFNGYLFYYNDDGVHCLDPEPEPMIWYLELKDKIENLFEIEKIEIEQLINSIQVVKKSLKKIEDDSE